MTVDKITVAPGAELSIIPTSKFKTNYLALNFYVPLEKARASRISLLTGVMNRGTERYPTIGDMNRYTDMLYELNFGTSVSAAGGLQSDVDPGAEVPRPATIRLPLWRPIRASH